MPFIGNQPALAFTSFAKQDFTTSATTSYTLDNPVANENEIALFINFVRQEPTTAYTASGVNLNLTEATSASDDMYCVFLGKAVQTVTPASGSVTNSMLASGSFSNITDVGTLSSGLTVSDNILFNTANKGIYLGVTSATASNLLDDYEEGTWTPAINSGVTSPIYSLQHGSYTKIGRMVYYNFDLRTIDGGLAAADFTVNGLPFTNSSNDQVNNGGSYFVYTTDVTTETGKNLPTITNANNSNQLNFYGVDGNRWLGTDMQNNTFIIIASGCYQTD